MGSKKVTKILFCFYFLALIWIILFKMQIPFSQMGHFRSVNLIPFAGSVVVNGRIYIQEIVYNVLIFIPFGVFSCMLGRSGSWLQRIAPSFFTSLALEALQFVLAAGASDITDLLGNTAGGAAGAGIFCIFSKICKEKADLVLNVAALAGAAGIGLLAGVLVLAN